MTEAIYIKKPEDIINLSPDRQNDITKDKNHINDKYKRRRDAQEGNPECDDKAVNNNENKFGYSGNYYVKEPGSEESLNTPSGYHDNDSEPRDTRDLDVADPPDTSNMNELTAYNYDDNTAGMDSIPLEPLTLDESFEENSRRLVEVDDDGNTLKTLPEFPPSMPNLGYRLPRTHRPSICFRLWRDWTWKQFLQKVTMYSQSQRMRITSLPELTNTFTQKLWTEKWKDTLSLRDQLELLKTNAGYGYQSSDALHGRLV